MKISMRTINQMDSFQMVEAAEEEIFQQGGTIFHKDGQQEI